MRYISARVLLRHILVAAVILVVLSARADSTATVATAGVPLGNVTNAAPGAAPLEPILPDSSNFVTASLLIASPSNEIYTCLGHCSIRMECPTHGLDYVYTLETDVQALDFLKFFSGQANAAFVAVPTIEFLPYYSNDGRQVTQYELNLTHHEKQRLWQLLDEDMVAGVHRKFNFLLNNCSSASTLLLEQAIIPSKLLFNEIPQPMKLCKGEYGRFLCRQSPWMEFLVLSLFGAPSDDFARLDSELEYLISPELTPTLFSNATIQDSDSNSRMVLKSSKEILPLVTPEKTHPLTPRVVFGALLFFVALVTILQLWKGWHRLAHATDATLLTLQTLAGLFLFYVTTVSCLFGLHWNWYLIVFNPLPLILWLLLRKRPTTMKRLYLGYTIILCSFMAMTPFLEQLDLEHQLITASLATRSASNYIQI